VIRGDRQDFDHRLGLEELLGTKEFTLFHCVGLLPRCNAQPNAYFDEEGDSPIGESANCVMRMRILTNNEHVLVLRCLRKKSFLQGPVTICFMECAAIAAHCKTE
jgi:hypothetical protein